MVWKVLQRKSGRAVTYWATDCASPLPGKAGRQRTNQVCAGSLIGKWCGILARSSPHLPLRCTAAAQNDFINILPVDQYLYWSAIVRVIRLKPSAASSSVMGGANERSCREDGERERVCSHCERQKRYKEEKGIWEKQTLLSWRQVGRLRKMLPGRRD